MPDSKARDKITPQYVRSHKSLVFSAVLGGAERLSVESCRTRRYPGLQATAPDTRAVYELAAGALSGVPRVLDWGAGAGVGTAELLPHFEQVLGLDTDLTAVRFARAYLPSVKMLHGEDLPTGSKLSDLEAICVVDVLGQCASPNLVLRNVRRALAASGRVFIAEPRAYPSQALLAPVVRAFSRLGLDDLLLRAGLEVEQWIENVGHFVACVARPALDQSWIYLEQGDAAQALGEAEDALGAYAKIPETAPVALRIEGLLACASVHARDGDIDAVGRCLLAAAALHPGHPRILAGLAEVSLVSGEKLQALSLAIRALENDPCELVAVQALARAADGLEQHDAFATWRIANGLGPADFETAIELSRSAANRGELAFAIWVLERLRDFGGELGAGFHETLSWLYVNAGRRGEAQLEAEVARVKAPDSDSVVELLAHLDTRSSAA